MAWLTLNTPYDNADWAHGARDRYSAMPVTWYVTSKNVSIRFWSVTEEELVLSPGGFVGVGNEVVPFTRPQYAANKACAEDTSAVWDEQEDLALVLMAWLTRREFWFLLQTQGANRLASVGQRSYVCRSLGFRMLLEAHATYHAPFVKLETSIHIWTKVFSSPKLID